jgi:uncharacterized protein
MAVNMINLIFSKDYTALEAALKSDPSLANKPVPLPGNEATAHPLHRIADGVQSGFYNDDDAVQLAQLFLFYGADINGGKLAVGKDSPLTAAASLNADKLAVFYIDKGANLHHRGCNGGTALHWAAWCGRDIVVKKLIDARADINLPCIEFGATPLYWAVHGYAQGAGNRHHQVQCARLLIDGGAQKETANRWDQPILSLLTPADTELKQLFS